MRRIARITASFLAMSSLVMSPLGCSGTKDPTPAKPAKDAPAGSAPGSAKGAVASVASTAPVNRWLRPPATEPHPAAKGLYRRATGLVQAGQLAEAEALFKQIRSANPDSRFARRLATDGFPIVEAAQLATVAIVFGVGAFMLSGDR